MWWSPYQILKSMPLVIRRTELYNVARLNVVGGVTVKYSADLDNIRIHYTMIPLNILISQFFLVASVTWKEGKPGVIIKVCKVESGGVVGAGVTHTQPCGVPGHIYTII